MFRKGRNHSFLQPSAPYPTEDYSLDFRTANKEEIIVLGKPVVVVVGSGVEVMAAPCFGGQHTVL